MSPRANLQPVQHKAKRWLLLFNVCSLQWQTRKAPKKAECNQSSHHIVGLGRSSSPISVFLVFPASPTEVLTHSWISQVPIWGEVSSAQCHWCVTRSQAHSTFQEKKKNQCISNLGPWHIRSSRKRAGNGIFKESNVLEENELLNPPSYCPVPNSKQFKSVFSAVTPLKIKWYAYFCCWKSLLLSGTRHHEYCQKLVTFGFFYIYWQSVQASRKGMVKTNALNTNL